MPRWVISPIPPPSPSSHSEAPTAGTRIRCRSRGPLHILEPEGLTGRVGRAAASSCFGRMHRATQRHAITPARRRALSRTASSSSSTATSSAPCAPDSRARAERALERGWSERRRSRGRDRVWDRDGPQTWRAASRWRIRSGARSRGRAAALQQPRWVDGLQRVGFVSAARTPPPVLQKTWRGGAQGGSPRACRAPPTRSTSRAGCRPLPRADGL